MPRSGALPPLPVDIASVPHDADVHEARAVVQRVDDAVVSDANPPQVRGPLQLDASPRPWIFRQSLDTRKDSSRHAGLQAFELAPSGAREDDRVLSHVADDDPGRAS